MGTITEKRVPTGKPGPSPVKVPRKPLQARIDEPLIDRVKHLAVNRRCEPRDIVTAALEMYLPGAELEAEGVK